MRFLLAVLLFSIVSCGKNKPNDTVEIPDHLKEKSKMYCDLAYENFYKPNKYIHHKCDGSGFTSLYSVACPHLDIDLLVFSDEQGKLFRDPNHECFEKGESRAESSKDMVIMRMTAAWYHKDLAWVDSFLEYAKKNRYKFCEADTWQNEISTCILPIGLISLLHDIQSRLKDMPTENNPEDVENDGIYGLSEDTYKSEDSTWDDLQKEINRVGFRAHLDTLRINLAGSVYGYISNSQRKSLKKLAEREPNNALYQMSWARWGDGSYEHVFNLLTDEAHWPFDRLPNNHKEHCTKYLYQRDEYKDGVYNPDWLPCPDEKFEEHPGVEFGLTLSKIL